MTESAVPTVLIDNDHVRVTRWDFAPGAATGWHRHEYDYVVVPLTDGTLKRVEADGDTESDLETGAPYFREAGVEHDVISANDHEFSFAEVELKR